MDFIILIKLINLFPNSDLLEFILIEAKFIKIRKKMLKADQVFLSIAPLQNYF